MADVLNHLNIKALSENDLSLLLEFDRHGLAPAPEEELAAYIQRLKQLMNARRDLLSQVEKNRKYQVVSGITLEKKAAIPDTVKEEAFALTEDLYAVRPDWVPGYFVNESCGFLWGGCSLSDPQSNLALFIIRKNFRTRQRWMIYKRRELLAHELCHAAHQTMDQWRFEEYFAYQTADSRLRRFFGCAFIHKFDAAGFLLPILLLPVVQGLNLFNIVHWPMVWFYILAALYPIYLFFRTVGINREIRRAGKFLTTLGIARPGAVLFRLTAQEIRELSKGRIPQINDLRKTILSQFGFNDSITGEKK